MRQRRPERDIKTMGVVITIDGLSGCKKTPTAALLAQTLGFYHLNSGLLYRQLAVVARKKGYNIESNKEMDKLVGSSLLDVFDVIAPRTSLGLIKYKSGEDAKRKYLVDNSEFYVKGIASMASKMASNKAIRDFLTAGQRSLIAYAQNVVLEGRDAGSTVFPSANHKFWFYANPADRARWKVNFEGLSADKKGLDKIASSLAARDLREMSRKTNPLSVTANSETIGVSGVSVQVLAEEIKKVVEGRPIVNLRRRIKSIKLASEMKKGSSSTSKVILRKSNYRTGKKNIMKVDKEFNCSRTMSGKSIRQSVLLSSSLYRRMMEYKFKEVFNGRRSSFQGLVVGLLDKFLPKKGLK